MTSSQHDLSANPLTAAPAAEQPEIRQAHTLKADDHVVEIAEIMQRLAQRRPAPSQQTPQKED